MSVSLARADRDGMEDPWKSLASPSIKTGKLQFQ